MSDRADAPLPADRIGLLDGLASTRSIRRYLDEPVSEADLRDMLFAATRAPSGSNRQPFRFVVMRDGPVARQAKALIGGAAREMWTAKRAADGYDRGSGVDDRSPKSRMSATMQHYVDHYELAPVLVLACLVRYRQPNDLEGASVYPACQNLLLAARGLGYGGVLTGFHAAVEAPLRSLLGLPDAAFIAATITIGRPAGHHGPVRRRPLAELVFEEARDQLAVWAIDPPGTRTTQAGPPRTES